MFSSYRSASPLRFAQQSPPSRHLPFRFLKILASQRHRQMRASLITISSILPSREFMRTGHYVKRVATPAYLTTRVVLIFRLRATRGVPDLGRFTAEFQDQ